MSGQDVTYEFCAAAACPTRGPGSRGTILIDEFRRFWFPRASGVGHYLPTDETTALATQALVSGAGETVVLGTTIDSTTAAANAAALQAAIDAGGVVTVISDGLAPISITLRVGSDTTLDLTRCQLQAFGVMGALITSKAFAAASTAVAMSWSANYVASVAWTAHGFSVGEFVWLNGADQGQFGGVFQVSTVTDANNFVVRLKRLPTTGPTGTVVGKRANINITLRGGRYSYNTAGGNTGTGSTRHTIVMAGVHNLEVGDIDAIDTSKFLVCVGAVDKYRIHDIGGRVMNSDCVKVYGPAFGGSVRNIAPGYAGDDLLSLQVKEPAAFAAYDFCHGDILDCAISSVRGYSPTGSFAFYLAPQGIIDGITVDGVSIEVGNGLPPLRIETAWTTGPNILGTVTVSGLTARTENALVTLGFTGITSQMVLRNLTLINPTMITNSALSKRLVFCVASNITGTINIIGGFAQGAGAIINTNANTGELTLNIDGLRIAGTGTQVFRVGAVMTLNANVKNLTMESNLELVSTAAVAAIVKLNVAQLNSPGVPTIGLGAGSFLRLAGRCDAQIDGAILDATVANHAPGASFYNTNAAFGAGVGAYVRGSAAWARVAA